MFQRDAEEHYFGSIIEVNNMKLRDSSVVGLFAKRDVTTSTFIDDSSRRHTLAASHKAENWS